MVKEFNSLYDLARYMQSEHQIDEWDMGCFIRTVDKVIHPLVVAQKATYGDLDIVLTQNEKDKNLLNISFVEKSETIDVNVSGGGLKIIPKTMDLFA